MKKAIVAASAVAGVLALFVFARSSKAAELPGVNELFLLCATQVQDQEPAATYSEAIQWITLPGTVWIKGTNPEGEPVHVTKQNQHIRKTFHVVNNPHTPPGGG